MFRRYKTPTPPIPHPSPDITVQLSRFLIRQFNEATRPARAVMFFEASGTNRGPFSGRRVLSSKFFPKSKDDSRFIDCGGASGDSVFAAITVPSAIVVIDDVTTNASFFETSATLQQPARIKHGNEEINRKWTGRGQKEDLKKNGKVGSEKKDYWRRIGWRKIGFRNKRTLPNVVLCSRTQLCKSKNQRE